jgi:16S rRNA G966 N2-methylase RsmD
MEYQVQIIESLQRTAAVDAASENEAVRLARRLYDEEEIVLDSKDFVGVDFTLHSVKPSLAESSPAMPSLAPLSLTDKKACDSTFSPSILPFYKSPNRDFTLLQGDCTELLPQFTFPFDMIFADPPYFLSNGGISVQSGKVVCVDKGEWDKGGSPEHIDRFNEQWLSC